MPLFTVESGAFSAEVEAADPSEAFREALKQNSLPEIFGELMCCKCSNKRLFKKCFIWTGGVLNELGIAFEHGPRKHSLRILPCAALEKIS